MGSEDLAAARGKATRGKDERGTSVIEAAIVSLAFFTLVLGLIEGASLMRDYLGVSDVVRTSVRTATTAGNDADADYDILQTLKAEGSALKTSSIKHIVVYKANGFGDKPTTTCSGGTSVSAVCNVYVPADLVRDRTEFGCKTASKLDSFWCPSTRKVASTVASGGPPDYIGVYVQYSHPMLSKMFGTTKTISDYSVIRLEPRKL